MSPLCRSIVAEFVCTPTLLDVVTVDQHHNPVSAIRQSDSFSTGSDSTVEVSGSRHGVTILEALSYDDGNFYTWSEETLTADHGISLLRVLEDRFGDTILVLLDRALYFFAMDLWEFVGDERATEFVGDTTVERVVGNFLQVWHFPSHAPELDPVEGCGNQLESWFNYRLVSDLDQLKTLLKTPFASIEQPINDRHSGTTTSRTEGDSR